MARSALVAASTPTSPVLSPLRGIGSGMGIETGIDLDALIDVGAWIGEQLGRPSASRVARAVLAQRKG